MSRCYAIGDPTAMCTPGFVQNPIGSTRDVDSPDLGGTVQVSPTVVDVSARPGQLTEIKYTFLYQVEARGLLNENIGPDFHLILPAKFICCIS